MSSLKIAKKKFLTVDGIIRYFFFVYLHRGRPMGNLMCFSLRFFKQSRSKTTLTILFDFKHKIQQFAYFFVETADKFDLCAF
jgi:hypothetical protein